MPSFALLKFTSALRCCCPNLVPILKLPLARPCLRGVPRWDMLLPTALIPVLHYIHSGKDRACDPMQGFVGCNDIGASCGAGSSAGSSASSIVSLHWALPCPCLLRAGRCCCHVLPFPATLCLLVCLLCKHISWADPRGTPHSAQAFTKIRGYLEHGGAHLPLKQTKDTLPCCPQSSRNASPAPADPSGCC